MATFKADIKTATDSKLSSDRPNVGRMSGRVRAVVSTYTVPTGGLAVADVLEWLTLPSGARVVPGSCKLYFAAGAASSTINVGDSVSAVRHLAATSVASAGSAICEASGASGAIYETTAEVVVQSVVAGAALLAGQVITLHMHYVVD